MGGKTPGRGILPNSFQNLVILPVNGACDKKGEVMLAACSLGETRTPAMSTRSIAMLEIFTSICHLIIPQPRTPVQQLNSYDDTKLERVKDTAAEKLILSIAC